MTDPCVAATINDPSLQAISVANGATATQTFDEATDSVDAAQTVQGLCGDRNYAVMNGNNGQASAVSWITITKDSPSINKHLITVKPLDTSLVTGQAHAFYLATSYAEYPNHAVKYTALSVQVTAATCDCNLLTWDNPSQVTQTINVGIQSPETVNIPPATVNVASKSASQDILTCYLG